jgi:hypothetical protein
MFEFKSEDIIKARRIVSQLKIPSQFGTDEDMDTFELENQLNDIMDEDFFVSCGVSKAVIIIDDLPFVIKIPFNGRWLAEWIDEAGEYDYDHKWFCEFSHAETGKYDDYCADELTHIIDIQEEGFGCFVPDMMYLCTVCGFDIYVQEKVEPLSETKQKIIPSFESVEKARKSGYWDTIWAAKAIDMYGFDFFEKFMKWMNKNCAGVVADLHYGNYGYDVGGRPVILDVSGFFD